MDDYRAVCAGITWSLPRQNKLYQNNILWGDCLSTSLAPLPPLKAAHGVKPSQVLVCLPGLHHSAFLCFTSAQVLSCAKLRQFRNMCLSLLVPVLLGWPKSSFGFSCDILWKNQNTLFFFLPAQYCQYQTLNKETWFPPEIL